ncbi:hypothetical protein B0O99DRAFT_120810 [Bisporella sp. PMI_857]|nr:hypothetical protein B0O99DRAFT_120810 [Bisporella sp. PMI_857]
MISICDLQFDQLSYFITLFCVVARWSLCHAIYTTKVVYEIFVKKVVVYEKYGHFFVVYEIFAVNIFGTRVSYPKKSCINSINPSPALSSHYGKVVYPQLFKV